MSIELAGFADPVLDAQRTFRVLLDAMASPGRIGRVAATFEPPAPLARATAAVLLALLDPDTPLWLAPRLAASRDWLIFHTGIAEVAEIHRAAFAAATELPDLRLLNAGTDAGPEESATLVLQLASLRAPAAPAWRLSGPGIAGSSHLAAAGLPEDFAARWAVNRGLFPRGIDLVLCAGDEMLALPRTVEITEL
ncbi:MAG: phosphonate C-P lyase system protein PhnH [Acidisphaera sp.]|nr:phosphonate C-P lyase system protein PhnH [Acidisphaera sp.]MBV9812413.1 phosphonate C-P lyase system protein PhnH [Acetobacteraceae bacterium]